MLSFSSALVASLAFLGVQAAFVAPRANSNTARAATYDLSSKFHVTSKPTTRTYDFTLSPMNFSTDGVVREIMAINGQYPGPLIEANDGDTIIVHVHNKLATGQGIHWHGITQRNSLWADGVPGITQCPIPAGQSFTYEFTLKDHSGFYWYHSHMGNTMADGVLGPIVVHSPSEPIQRGRDYDYDQIIMLGDWFHDSSDKIVAALTSGNGYRGAFTPPAPDALLINGVGQCTAVVNQTITPCAKTALPEIQVIPNKRYRLRILNYSSHAHYKFSIDAHKLNVTAADDTPINGPDELHQLPIGSGERYETIITTDQSMESDAFFIRAAVCLASTPGTVPGYDITARAVLRYVPQGKKATTHAPTSVDWMDSSNNETTCYDMPDKQLVPLVKKTPPQTAIQSTILNSVVGVAPIAQGPVPVLHFSINDVIYANYIYNPMMMGVYKGGSLNGSAIASATFNKLGGADIIINNLDTIIDHPYHLHGNPFWIVARGSGNLTAADYKALPASAFNLDNPIYRDTMALERNSWAILRIQTDNPGVWALHCHVGWHLAVGKMAVINVRPDAFAKQQKIPSASMNQCNPKYFPPGDTKTTIAAGRRSVFSIEA